MIALALDGEVLYTLTKKNPRYNRGGSSSYTAVDRTQPGAEQKVYVPFKPATTVPQHTSTNEAGGLDGFILAVPLLTIALGFFVCVKTGFCRQLVAKYPAEASSSMYEPTKNMQETMTDSTV